MRDGFLNFIPLGGIFLVMPVSMHTAFFVAGVVGRCRHQLEARGGCRGPLRAAFLYLKRLLRSTPKLLNYVPFHPVLQGVIELDT